MLKVNKKVVERHKNNANFLNPFKANPQFLQPVKTVNL